MRIPSKWRMEIGNRGRLEDFTYSLDTNLTIINGVS